MEAIGYIEIDCCMYKEPIIPGVQPVNFIII